MNKTVVSTQLKWIIGLTGAIASGKSTVAEIMKDWGAEILDADQLARQVVEKGSPALEEIVEIFGERVLKVDGSLDRQWLGNLVFGDPVKLEQLNRITHPRIRQLILDQMEAFRKQESASLLVIEAALLFETGLDRLVDQVWLVEAPLESRLQRLMDRNALTRDEALKRIKSQASGEDKRRRADVIIENTEDPARLARQVIKALDENIHRLTGIEGKPPTAVD